MRIVPARLEHLAALIPLFNAYRVFSGCAPDADLAGRFLHERLEKEDSFIFLAVVQDHGCGFAQLYPTVSSIMANKTLVLNDLYVHPDYRRRGVAKALMDRLLVFAKERGYAGIWLETSRRNRPGRRLYESLGFRRLKGHCQYYKSLNR